MSAQPGSTRTPLIDNIAHYPALRHAVIAVFAGVAALLVVFLVVSVRTLGYPLTAPYILSTLVQILIAAGAVVVALARKVVPAMRLFVGGFFLSLIIEPHIVQSQTLGFSLMLMPAAIAGLLVVTGLVFERRLVAAATVLGAANTLLVFATKRGAPGAEGLPLLEVMPLLAVIIVAAGVGTLVWDSLAARLIGRAETAALNARQLADEREVLVRESSHRVKNNLQVIMSMLDLQARELDDTGARDVLGNARNRVAVMAVVHESLHDAGTLDRVDIARFLQDLVDQLVASMADPTARFYHVVEAPSVEVPPKTLVPLGLVVNELVTNALHHGRGQGEDATAESLLRVLLRPGTQGDTYELVVADTGAGLPEGFTIEGSDSLGLSLVQTLVRDQLGGSFSMRNDGGTVAVAELDGSLFTDAGNDGRRSDT